MTAPWSLRNVPDTSTSTFGMVYDPSPVRRVTYPESAWQYGLTWLTFVRLTSSGRRARTSHTSVTVFPELSPPWNVRPPRVRAVMLIRTPLYREYSSPKSLPQVVRLLICPKSEGVTSNKSGTT